MNTKIIKTTKTIGFWLGIILLPCSAALSLFQTYYLYIDCEVCMFFTLPPTLAIAATALILLILGFLQVGYHYFSKKYSFTNPFLPLLLLGSSGAILFFGTKILRSIYTATKPIHSLFL